MTEPAPPPLTEGVTIANRFRLERLLGKGGMGSVWVAQHLTLHVDVAVKFIDPTLASTDEIRSRFAAEAQAAAKINSPHVVRMVDHGVDEAGRSYIAMELLQGEELAARLERDGQLSLADTVQVVAQACKGLTKAHAAGIVHRDLKPENLFLVEEDDGFVVKILDFGIAKAQSPIGATQHKTGTGQIIGTPMYMSPEQALGAGKVDFRSDLYSLAVVAYRCLTGVVPFSCEGLGELIVAITTRPHTPPSSLRPGLPPGVDRWFARAMAKEADRRFASAKEMADALAAAAGIATGSTLLVGASDPTTSRREPGPQIARAGTLVGATSALDEPATIPTRPVGLYVAIGAVVAALGVGATIFLARSSHDATPASSPPVPASDARPAPPPPAASPAITVVPVDPSPPPAASSATIDAKKAPPKPGHVAPPPEKKPPSTTPPPPKDYGL